MDADQRAEVQAMIDARIAESLERIAAEYPTAMRPLDALLREEAARLAPKVEPEWPKRFIVGYAPPGLFTDCRDAEVEVYPAGAVGRLVEALRNFHRGGGWQGDAAGMTLDAFRAALRGGGKGR